MSLLTHPTTILDIPEPVRKKILLYTSKGNGGLASILNFRSACESTKLWLEETPKRFQANILSKGIMILDDKNIVDFAADPPGPGMPRITSLAVGPGVSGYFDEWTEVYKFWKGRLEHLFLNCIHFPMNPHLGRIISLPTLKTLSVKNVAWPNEYPYPRRLPPLGATIKSISLNNVQLPDDTALGFYEDLMKKHQHLEQLSIRPREPTQLDIISRVIVSDKQQRANFSLTLELSECSEDCEESIKLLLESLNECQFEVKLLNVWSEAIYLMQTFPTAPELLRRVISVGVSGDNPMSFFDDMPSLEAIWLCVPVQHMVFPSRIRTLHLYYYDAKEDDDVEILDLVQEPAPLITSTLPFLRLLEVSFSPTIPPQHYEAYFTSIADNCPAVVKLKLLKLSTLNSDVHIQSIRNGTLGNHPFQRMPHLKWLNLSWDNSSFDTKDILPLVELLASIRLERLYIITLGSYCSGKAKKILPILSCDANPISSTLISLHISCVEISILCPDHKGSSHFWTPLAPQMKNIAKDLERKLQANRKQMELKGPICRRSSTSVFQDFDVHVWSKY